MISELLDLINEFVLLKAKGEDTIMCKKDFAKAINSYVDFRVQADKRDIKKEAIAILINAPEPGSDNFEERYQAWYEEAKKLF